MGHMSKIYQVRSSCKGTGDTWDSEDLGDKAASIAHTHIGEHWGTEDNLGTGNSMYNRNIGGYKNTGDDMRY